MTGSVVWRVTRWLLLLGFAAFFAIPLLSMLDFSTQVPGSAPGRTGQAWRNLVASPELAGFLAGFFSFGVFAIAVSLEFKHF